MISSRKLATKSPLVGSVSASILKCGYAEFDGGSGKEGVSLAVAVDRKASYMLSVVTGRAQ